MRKRSHVLSRPRRTLIVGITILLIGIIFSLAAPAAAQQPVGEVNVSSQSGIVPPGESIELNATVTNTGNRSVGQLEVWITNPPAAWNTSNATIQRLKPNQSTTVPLNISVPRDEETGSYNLTVRVESPDNISAESTMQVDVGNVSVGPGTPTPTDSGGRSSEGSSTNGGGGGGPMPQPCDKIPFTDYCWPSFDLPSLGEIFDRLF